MRAWGCSTPCPSRLNCLPFEECSYGGGVFVPGKARGGSSNTGIVSPEQRRQAAREASARLLRLPEVVRAANVFTCLSFGNEIDTSGLTEGLLSSGRTVYVSRSDLKQQQRLNAAGIRAFGDAHAMHENQVAWARKNRVIVHCARAALVRFRCKSCQRAPVET